MKAKKTYKEGGKVDPNNPSEGRVAKRQTRRAKRSYKKFMKSPGGKQGKWEIDVGEIDKVSVPNGRKQYKRGGKVVAQGADKDDVRSERRQNRVEKRKSTKGTYDVEVDGISYQVEGKKKEKRGGKAVKFKAKGRGDGFGIKIKDKVKFTKDGLVKKEKKNTKYTK